MLYLDENQIETIAKPSYHDNRLFVSRAPNSWVAVVVINELVCKSASNFAVEPSPTQSTVSKSAFTTCSPPVVIAIIFFAPCHCTAIGKEHGDNCALPTGPLRNR